MNKRIGLTIATALAAVSLAACSTDEGDSKNTSTGSTTAASTATSTSSATATETSTAGTTEAGALARALADRGADAVYSYAGRTANPVGQPLPTRVGGFGGIEGMMAYLRQQSITHVVDATHPFAAQISHNAVAACLRSGVS